MNQKLVTVVEAKHHNLEKSASSVKPESQLACRAVLVEVADEDRVLGAMDLQDQLRACARSRARSRDVGTDCCSNRLRATDVITLGPFDHSSQETSIDPHRHHLRRSIPERLSSTLAEPTDVVATFGFVCPVLDVLVGHWLAVDLRHTQIVIRKARPSR